MIARSCNAGGRNVHSYFTETIITAYHLLVAPLQEVLQLEHTSSCYGYCNFGGWTHPHCQKGIQWTLVHDLTWLGTFGGELLGVSATPTKPQTKAPPNWPTYKTNLYIPETNSSIQCFQTTDTITEAVDALLGPIFSTIDDDIPQCGFYDLHGADIAHPDPIIEAETLPVSNQLAAILVQV